MDERAGKIERYLHEHIPLTGAMGVSVKRVGEDSLTLSAPLEPNINHRETVFGGSASALGILAAWSLIHVRLNREFDPVPRLVIQRNSMEYRKPITNEFESTCSVDDPAIWRRFVRSIQRKGLGRIELKSALTCEGEDVGGFVGTFVALAGA